MGVDDVTFNFHWESVFIIENFDRNKRFFMNKDSIKLSVMLSAYLIGNLLNFNPNMFDLELVDGVLKDSDSSVERQIIDTGKGHGSYHKIKIDIGRIPDFASRYSAYTKDFKYACYLELWASVIRELRSIYQYIIVEDYTKSLIFGRNPIYNTEDTKNIGAWQACLLSDEYKPNNALEVDTNVFTDYILNASGLINKGYKEETKELRKLYNSFRKRYNHSFIKYLDSLYHTPKVLYEKAGKVWGYRLR